MTGMMPGTGVVEPVLFEEERKGSEGTGVVSACKGEGGFAVAAGDRWRRRGEGEELINPRGMEVNIVVDDGSG